MYEGTTIVVVLTALRLLAYRVKQRPQHKERSR